MALTIRLQNQQAQISAETKNKHISGRASFLAFDPHLPPQLGSKHRGTSGFVEAPTLTPLISVPSQVVSGRQDKDALDPLAEQGSEVPNVPSQKMCGISFDGRQ